MPSIRQNLCYNLEWNQKARLPFVSTFVGLSRVCIHLFSLAKNMLFWIFKEREDFYLAQAYVDLRGIIRGVIEIPPLIGSLGSWFMDSHFLSPAQKVAYRIQEIYRSRIAPNDDWVNNEPDLVDIETLRTKWEAVKEDNNYLRVLTLKNFDFLNRQKVKCSTNQEKILTFITKFKNGEFSDPIFAERKLPFYAMTALITGAIDQKDMATIMEIYVAKQCYGDDVTIECLFDDRGELTASGNTLVESIKENNALKEESKKKNNDYLKNDLNLSAISVDIEAFKKAASALPRHKQIVWSHKALVTKQDWKRMSGLEKTESLYCPIGVLNFVGAMLRSVVEYQGREVDMSFDLETCFLRTKYNKPAADPFLPKLGIFSARDIKKAITDKRARICATFFPGAPHIKTLHHALELPTTIVRHDKIHAHILEHYPTEVFDFIQDLRKEFEQVTGVDMSKEIWEMLELTTIFAINACDSETQVITILFCFFRDMHGRIDDLRMLELMVSDSILTPLGIMFLLKLYDRFNDQYSGVLSDMFKYYDIINKAYAEGSLLQRDTTKQKIWKVQQLTRGQSITATPSDDQLKFRRITDGKRKNTLVLETV